MQYLHQPIAYTNGTDNAPKNLLATGTAYKQVQIYDIRTVATTRRPVLYTPEKLLSHRTTAICQLPDGNTLAVGDSIGNCHLIDMRKMHYGNANANKLRKKSSEEIGLGRLVGPGGSIRQLAVKCVGSINYLACVGLDRKLWTWNLNRQKMVDCVYLKQKLNCVLFCEDGSWDGMDFDSQEEESVPYTEWQDTDPVDDETMRGVTEEDDVEDYVDSEDDTNAGERKHEIARDCDAGSSDEDCDGSYENGEESDSGETEEEDLATNMSFENLKKRQRRQR